MALYFLQVPLMSLLRGQSFSGERFVSLPLIYFAPIIIIAALHFGLLFRYWIVMGREDDHVKQLSVLSILSFIFVFGVSSIINGLFYPVYNMYIAQKMGIRYMGTFATLNTLMNYGLSFRGLAFSALLIAAGMSFYYSYIKKIELTNDAKQSSADHLGI